MSEVLPDVLTEATGQEILGNIKLGNAYLRAYLKKWEIDSWNTLFEIARSGVANQVFAAGDQIIGKYTVNGTEYECPWDILDFRDVTALVNGVEVEYKNVPLIQMHYTNTVNVAFDPAEQIEATETTAQDGLYYYGFDGANYTALNLSAGDAIPYSSYTEVFVTPYNSVNAIRYGNSDWELSFLRQYLNNSGTGWAAKQHDYDVLPSGAATMLGFMSYLESEMVNNLHPVKIHTKQATYAGGELLETWDKFFPLSVSEMNMYNGNASADDGEPTAYYKALLESESKKATGTYPALIKYAVNALTTAQNVRLRGANLGNNNVWNVNTSGNVNNNNPNNAYRVAPDWNPLLNIRAVHRTAAEKRNSKELTSLAKA